jgi:hypothetical protein
MYVFMYVRMYVMYVGMYVCMYVCMETEGQAACTTPTLTDDLIICYDPRCTYAVYSTMQHTNHVIVWYIDT